MRLTVLGTGTAKPVADTPASGILIEVGDTAVLFDIGSGVASRLEASVGAARLTGLVVGHFHADHWIDLAPLRYRFNWGETSATPLPVHMPPGARAKVDALAVAMAEREGFFDAQFRIIEYASGEAFQIGRLTITPQPVGHYVPAWSMDIRDDEGHRVVYAGDMGPSDGVVELARGADLLILEATLENAATDDTKRGHLSAEEAIEHVRRAGVPHGLLVHYPADGRDRIAALCAASGVPVEPARSMQVYEVGSAGRSGAEAATGRQETVRTG
jgi:ribonuclease BN (tRNA processing enzyme)